MRKVPSWLMNQILGKEKVESGEPLKKGGRRSIMKTTALRRGRKDPGQRNPRGGRYKSEDIQQQLTGPVGSHGEEGKQVQEDVVKKIMAAERGKNFNREDVLRRLEAEKSGKDIKNKQRMLKSKKKITVEEEPDDNEPDDDKDD